MNVRLINEDGLHERGISYHVSTAIGSPKLGNFRNP